MPISPDYDFIDGVAMHSVYPDTFEVPNIEQKMAVVEGYHVKVGAASLDGPGERFWVKVTKKTPFGVFGRIDNMLVYTRHHGLNYGDEVEVLWKHILDIAIHETKH